MINGESIYQSPRGTGIILRGVNLPWVSYPVKSCDYPGSYLKGHSYEILDLNLPGVAYPGEIDSTQYDTPGRLTFRGTYDTPGRFRKILI